MFSGSFGVRFLETSLVNVIVIQTHWCIGNVSYFDQKKEG